MASIQHSLHINDLIKYIWSLFKSFFTITYRFNNKVQEVVLYVTERKAGKL